MSGLESNRYTGSDHVDVMEEIEHASSRYEVPLDSLSPNQAEAMRTLGELANLPPNWDGYGSPPPTRVALNVVMDVLLHIDDRNLPSVRVVPVSGGGIQLEWRVSTRELQLEISCDGSAQYLQLENGVPFFEEELVSLTMDRAKSLASWLIPSRPQKWAA
jgi:hypothetical protein